MKCIALLVGALAFVAAQDPDEAAFMKDYCSCVGAAEGKLSDKVKKTIDACIIQEFGVTQQEIDEFKSACSGARRRRNAFVPHITKRNPFVPHVQKRQAEEDFEKAFNDCLTEKGCTAEEVKSVTAAGEQIDTCMKDKGYDFDYSGSGSGSGEK